LSSLPPPSRVTNPTSLVPQILSKAAVAAKPKTPAVSQLARVEKPVVRESPAARNRVIDDSDDDGGDAADFFALDASDKPATHPAAFQNREAVDVRWIGSTSRVEHTVTSEPSYVADVPATAADMVWNSTNYTSPVTDYPPVGGTAVVCTYSDQWLAALFWNADLSVLTAVCFCLLTTVMIFAVISGMYTDVFMFVKLKTNNNNSSTTIFILLSSMAQSHMGEFMRIL